jgi:hypothetical protein
MGRADAGSRNRKSAPSRARVPAQTAQPHPSGQMLGFFPIVLASGLVINDCRLMKGKTGLWVALPAQRQVDSDGPARTARTGPDGKPIYSPLLEFSDKQTSNRLLDLCLGLIKRVDPDALAYEDLS